MSKPTKLYRWEHILAPLPPLSEEPSKPIITQIDPTAKNYVVISPEGERSMPTTYNDATTRCNNLNALINAGNKLMADSEQRICMVEDGKVARGIIQDLVTQINDYVILSCPDPVVESVARAEEWLAKNP